jgi:glyoxylase-like metal-dependent hydrolase (beta-lactamase superfamily II)
MRERSFGPVRFIPGPNRGKYPYCHSVYIEGAGILIDPSADRERLKRLRDEEGVQAVWLSHWHEDHFMHLKLLAKPCTLDDIVIAWIVYRKPREPLDFYVHAEKALMGKHLQELLADGRVVRTGNRFRCV